MISPLLVASTGARTTLLALADTRRSWAPPTPTPRIPDQVVGVAPRSAPLQAAGAFDALLVCAPLVYSINKSLYGTDGDEDLNCCRLSCVDDDDSSGRLLTKQVTVPAAGREPVKSEELDSCRRCRTHDPARPPAAAAGPAVLR